MAWSRTATGLGARSFCDLSRRAITRGCGFAHGNDFATDYMEGAIPFLGPGAKREQSVRTMATVSAKQAKAEE
jgi:hypothetical protein